MEKILITGGSGLLGGNIAMMAGKKFETYTAYHLNPIKIGGCNTFRMDITDRRIVTQTITKIRPSLLIHTAALTNVDYCKDHPEEAWNLNVEGTRNLAEVAEKIDTKFIYISTDSIFDGKRGMYTEEDAPNPINYYAKTKSEGEKLLEEFNLNYCVVRTCIYGWNIQNKFSLAEWVLNGLQNKKILTMFTDVFFSPILVNNLAVVLFEIYERDSKDIFQVAGAERCSKFHFGEKIAEIFNLDKKLIKPISINDFTKFRALRPKDSSLNVTKAKKEFRTKLLDVEEGIIWMNKLLDEGYVRRLRGSRRGPHENKNWG